MLPNFCVAHTDHPFGSMCLTYHYAGNYLLKDLPFCTTSSSAAATAPAATHHVPYLYHSAYHVLTPHHATLPAPLLPLFHCCLTFPVPWEDTCLPHWFSTMNACRVARATCAFCRLFAAHYHTFFACVARSTLPFRYADAFLTAYCAPALPPFATPPHTRRFWLHCLLYGLPYALRTTTCRRIPLPRYVHTAFSRFCAHARALLRIRLRNAHWQALTPHCRAIFPTYIHVYSILFR